MHIIRSNALFFIGILIAGARIIIIIIGSSRLDAILYCYKKTSDLIEIASVLIERFLPSLQLRPNRNE